jgi:hypothetical protein
MKQLISRQLLHERARQSRPSCVDAVIQFGRFRVLLRPPLGGKLVRDWSENLAHDLGRPTLAGPRRMPAPRQGATQRLEPIGPPESQL